MALSEGNTMKKIMSLIIVVLFTACTHLQKASVTEDSSNYVSNEIKAAAALQSRREINSHSAEMPDFVPMREGSSPLNTKTISVTARNTPLRDVLYTIAETADLNLVLERNVEPELPITMTLNNIGIEDALNIIFNSVDYFYTVKENILVVKAMDTRIYELGQPNVIQEYSIDVGGNIISGTSTGEQSNTSLSGDVSIKSKGDTASYQFWDAMQSNLETLLTVEDDGENKGQKANFIVNRMAGTIMVTATKKDLEKVESYIGKLKKVLNRQVLIDARIVEVQLTSGLKYGIDWEAVNSWFGVGTTTFGTTNFSAVVDSTSPRFNFSITNNDNLSLVLQALQEQGDVSTLSNPRVQIMNGQTTLLSVGRNVSFISRVESTTATSEGSAAVTSFTVDTSSILSGIMFGIVPYINGDGEIALTITPIITDLINLDEQVIGSGGNAVEIKLPTVDLREMTTTVKVMDGQMIIIGGLITRKENLQEDKVPLLSDIPVLGDAFKRYDKSNETKELVIMLIPRLIS
jgi:MSHA type pilus biogenesis protein MshL